MRYSSFCYIVYCMIEIQLFNLMKLHFIQIQISDVDTLRPSQESVLQDMLMIDFLQVDIVTILLERIKRIACDE